MSNYKLDRDIVTNSLLEYDNKGIHIAFLLNVPEEHHKKVRDLIHDTIHTHGHLFIDEFYSVLREDDENIISLIIPFVKRVYSNFFIKPPSIFDPINTVDLSLGPKNSPILINNYDRMRSVFGSVGSSTDRRLHLFQAHFDLKDLLVYFKDKIENNINILDDFNYLDKYTSILTLMVDDYVGMKLKLVQDSLDHKGDLRDLKINKIND